MQQFIVLCCSFFVRVPFLEAAVWMEAVEGRRHDGRCIDVPVTYDWQSRDLYTSSRAKVAHRFGEQKCDDDTMSFALLVSLQTQQHYNKAIGNMH